MREGLGIVVKKEKVVVSSIDVAEIFGKEHYHVLRDIKGMNCSEEFRLSNFGLSSHINSQNKKQPMYLMTKDGFTMLAMGYKTKKAMEFKESYAKADAKK